MPYKRKRKNKTEWIADVMRQGKRYYKIFNTKTEAIAWESDIRKSPIEDLMIPSESLKLIDWATTYLEYAKAKFTVRTFKEKKVVFKGFFKSVDPSSPVEKLKPVQVLNYLRDQALKRSGYAANKERKNLLAAWNWGIKYLNLPLPNPCLTERFPENRQNRYIPPESDFWKVYEVTNTRAGSTHASWLSSFGCQKVGTFPVTLGGCRFLQSASEDRHKKEIGRQYGV